MNVASIGKEIQDQCIKECSENSNRFENEAIRRTKIVKSTGKLQEVKMERDLFGKILCLALQQKIDEWSVEISINTCAFGLLSL